MILLFIILVVSVTSQNLTINEIDFLTSIVSNVDGISPSWTLDNVTTACTSFTNTTTSSMYCNIYGGITYFSLRSTNGTINATQIDKLENLSFLVFMNNNFSWINTLERTSYSSFNTLVLDNTGNLSMNLDYITSLPYYRMYLVNLTRVIGSIPQVSPSMYNMEILSCPGVSCPKQPLNAIPDLEISFSGLCNGNGTNICGNKIGSTQITCTTDETISFTECEVMRKIHGYHSVSCHNGTIYRNLVSELTTNGTITVINATLVVDNLDIIWSNVNHHIILQNSTLKIGANTTISFSDTDTGTYTIFISEGATIEGTLIYNHECNTLEQTSTQVVLIVPTVCGERPTDEYGLTTMQIVGISVGVSLAALVIAAAVMVTVIPRIRKTIFPYSNREVDNT